LRKPAAKKPYCLDAPGLFFLKTNPGKAITVLVRGENPVIYGADEADHPAGNIINGQYDLVTLTLSL
jgi:hypothetical protein